MRGTVRGTLAALISVLTLLGLLPSTPAAAAPVVQITLAPLPAGVMPGVAFPVTVAAVPSAGASLKTVRITAVNCSSKPDSTIIATSAQITCPALLKDALVTVYATDTLGGTGSAAARITFATTPTAVNLGLARAGTACAPAATLQATATAPSGDPVSGVPVVFRLTPPTGSTAAPILYPRTTGPDGVASYAAATRPDWTATATTTGIGPWRSASSTAVSLTQDACSIALDLTRSVPSRVPVNERMTITGTVSALRPDGETGPLRGATVSIRQLVSTTTPPSTKTLTSVVSGSDGSWTALVRPADSGPLTAHVSASPKDVSPATASFDLGSITTAQYIATIEASATAVTAPLLAGARATVAGRLSATNPVTGDSATVPAGVPLEVYFTSTGSTGATLAGKTTTTAGGSFTVAAKARSNGVFTVKLPAGTKAYAAAPAVVPVNVTGRVTLGGMTATAATGRAVTANVSVNPKRRSPAVIIEVKGTGDWTPVATVGTGLVSFKAPTEAGVYQVRARHAGDTLAAAGVSPALTLTVTTGPAVATPENLSCSSRDGKLPTCAWNAPAGTSPSSYRVYQNGTTLIGETSVPSFTVSSTYARSGLTTPVTVKAVTAGKETAASPPDTYTMLATPSGLVQSARTATSATLSWTAVAGAAGYDVSINGGPAEQVEDPTYTVQGIDPGTSVTVTVTAFSEGDDTSAAASLRLTTENQTAGSPPANLTCTSANSSQLVCTWVAVPGATGYRVYRSGALVTSSINAEYPYPAPVAGLVKSTGATLTGLSVGDTLTLAVTAVSAARESLYSNLVSATVTTPPQRLTTPVPYVSALDGSASGVTLQWPAVANAVAYDVTASGKGTARVYDTSAKITGLTAGSVTTVTVTAVAGTGYVNSYAPTIRVRPDVGATPASVTCTSPSAGTVSCQWAAVPGATGYALFKDGVQVTSSITANTYWPAAAGGQVQSTGIAASGLAAGATYDFTVKAIVNGSFTDPSAPVTLKVTSPPPPALPAPVPYLDSASGTTATVSWAAVTGAESYRVTISGQSAVTVTEPTATFAGLTAGVVYTVTVYAQSASSSNSPSAQLRIRSDATDSASALTCGSYSVGQVSCQFAAGIDAVGYQVVKDGVTLTSGVSAQSPFPAASAGLVRSTTLSFSATAGSTPVIAILTHGPGGTLTTSASVTVTVLASTPVLSAPVPYVSEATGTGFTLAWEAVPNATSYLVTVVGVGTQTVTAGSATVTGLTAGTVYQVYVRAQATGYTSSPQAGLRVNPAAGAL